MGVGLIKRIFGKHIQKELTPKGECFREYIKKLNNGSDDTIEAYEEDIDKIHGIWDDVVGVEISRNDLVELLNIYFDENFS